MLNLSDIFKILEINLPASPMYLFRTWAVCCEAIRDRSTDFSFVAKDYEKKF